MLRVSFAVLSRVVPKAVWLSCLGLIAGCLADAVAPPVSGIDPRVAEGLGIWMFHIDGGRFIENVELLEVRGSPDSGSPLHAVPIPSLNWLGQETNAFKLRTSAVARTSAGWESTLILTEGDVVKMRYRVLGDTALGEAKVFDNAGDSALYGLFGVRVPLGALEARFIVASEDTVRGSTPTVLIELDDNPGEDRAFLRRLFARSLVAMIAVPTEFVGRQGRPTWDELRSWATLGFGVAAHSRWHSALTKDGPNFASEVIGSLATMSDQGLGTSVFVQPGNWPEGLNFDSASKFQDWHGSLLRTFTRVFESKFRPSSVIAPVTDSIAFGIDHWTISRGVSDSTILKLWKKAQEPNHFTIFLVHTWQLNQPGALDWFLDTLASANRAGRIRVVHSITDVLQ